MMRNLQICTRSRFTSRVKSLGYAFLCFSVLAFVGCEKKELEDTEDDISIDTPPPVEEHKELSMYARVTHTGDAKDFNLDLNVEIAGKDAHNTTISGRSWAASEKRSDISILYHWYGKFDNEPIILRPSKKVGYLSVATAYGVEKYTEEVMHVKVEFFVEGKLVKTDQFSFVGKDGKTTASAVQASDYMD